MLERITRANDGKHKYVAHFSNGRITRFGAVSMDDYTITHDKEQRTRYRQRHEKDLATNDPYRAGYLSYYILWGASTDIGRNVASYNRRFF